MSKCTTGIIKDETTTCPEHRDRDIEILRFCTSKAEVYIRKQVFQRSQYDPIICSWASMSNVSRFRERLFSYVVQKWETKTQKHYMTLPNPADYLIFTPY